MKRLAIATLLIGLSAAPHVGFADTPATQPDQTEAAAAAAQSGPIIGELDIPENSLTLAQFLPVLKQKVPSFEYVAMPGNWQNLMLPQLQLRSIPFDEMISLLGALYPNQMVIQPIVDASSSTNQPQITRSNSLFQGTDPNSKAPHTIFVFVPVQTMASQNTVVLKSFGLSDTINVQVARDRQRLGTSVAPNVNPRKQATTELISLIENVAKQAAQDGPPATISIHEETETLLVKGSRRQIEAITEAVATLSTVPTKSDLAQRKEDEAIVRREILQLEQKLAGRDQELMELKIRMDMYMKQNQPQPADKK